MAKNKLTNCKSCGHEIAAKGKVTCPSCGRVNKKPVYKRAWFIILVVMIGLSSLGGLGDSEDKPATVETSSQTEVVKSQEEKSDNKSSEEVSSSEPIKEEVFTGTVSQKQALRKAESYLNFTAYSKKGLVDQLKFEGFSEEDAIYGTENCEADWMEQAVLKSESYLDFTAYSYSGLIEQLKFEEFTDVEATHGADNCNADWMEQAVLKAESYLDFMAYSRNGLIEQLEFEGFTNSEAVHGVNGVGL